jgi:peptidoglycan/xylan/chitin deacetylase (PgdA/CDA1 family)
LTFDDGPHKEITPWTLQTLKAYNAKATFFCVGENVEKHPTILQNILDDGHAVGNHTENHIKGWTSTLEVYLENVDTASKRITSNLFRPPYGQITPKQGKALMKLGYHIIMWNVLTLDWDASISKETCLSNALNNLKSGSVLVFHDSEKASNNMQYALPKVLEYFSAEGYTFKAIKI